MKRVIVGSGVALTANVDFACSMRGIQRVMLLSESARVKFVVTDPD